MCNLGRTHCSILGITISYNFCKRVLMHSCLKISSKCLIWIFFYFSSIWKLMENELSSLCSQFFWKEIFQVNFQPLCIVFFLLAGCIGVCHTLKPIAIKSIFGKFWSISDVLARWYLFMLKIILHNLLWTGNPGSIKPGSKIFQNFKIKCWKMCSTRKYQIILIFSVLRKFSQRNLCGICWTEM